MKILIISSECAPYQKSGGLADANADFSSAYKHFYNDDYISVILPLYNIQKPLKNLIVDGYNLKQIVSFSYKYGVNRAKAYVYKVINPFNNIPVFFVYSTDYSKETEQYSGDIFRNSTSFSHAVLNYLDKFLPAAELPDIIQTTDFPLFLKDFDFKRKDAKNIKLIHVVHNAGSDYQNQTDLLQAVFCGFNKQKLKEILESKTFCQLCKDVYRIYIKNPFYTKTLMFEYLSKNYSKIATDELNQKKLERLNFLVSKYFEGYVENDYYFNPMMKHIEYCDFWITDSYTYYNELMTRREYSGSLFEVIKKTKDKSCAVLAGINPERFNPKNSSFIEYNFENIKDREANKEYLLRNFSASSVRARTFDKRLFFSKLTKIAGGFENPNDKLLIFMSSRCDINQKGIDIAFCAMKEVLKRDDVLFLFSSPYSFNNGYVCEFLNFLNANDLYKGKFVFIDSYVPIERFCAGSDLFLMPSRFEPCGFSQLIAMRFGCIPVVIATGGLNDTVENFTADGTGNGFKTSDSFYNFKTRDEYQQCLLRAIETVKDKEIKNKIAINAMNYDCSWNEAKIESYNKIYLKVLNNVTNSLCVNLK